jgi:hypothetical protein
MDWHGGAILSAQQSPPRNHEFPRNNQATCADLISRMISAKPYSNCGMATFLRELPHRST